MKRNTGNVPDVQMLNYRHYFINLTSSFHQEKREEKVHPLYSLANGSNRKRQINITCEFSRSGWDLGAVSVFGSISPLSRVWSTLPEKNGCTRERQTISVMSIHHLIHAALLVAGNVIWLQPTTLNIRTIAVLHVFFFLVFAFPTYFVFPLLLRKSVVCMNAVFYGRVRFLSRAAPFDCDLANWSCMSRSIKGDILVCMIKLIPCNLSRMFC